MIPAALAIVTFAAASALAAPNPTRPAPTGGNPAVMPVANGCGAGWHWRPGWRDRYGNWHPGHCVPN
jgi:hypothetical protein